MALTRGYEIKTILVLTLTLVSFGAEGVALGPRRGLIGETVFDVTKYEAKGDGKFENAQAFIKTWDAACKSSGPAKVVIPPGSYMGGEIVFQGPCTAPKPITIELQGTLLASTDLSVFTRDIWITIQDVDGLIFTGGGTINGQGEANWKNACPSGECDSRLPDSLVFEKVSNSAIRGINFVNSKGFHMKVTESNNMMVENLHISAPEDSPNTDGIHISGSVGVNVSSSIIGTGDDCISIGDGNTDIGIRNVTCGPGHGISVGSLGKYPDEKDVKGVTVTNCTLSSTTNGARIKTIHNSPNIQASGITYQDIIMVDVKNPILIDQHYNSKNIAGASNVKINDVHFKNIKGTTISNVAVALNCSEAVPCEGVELVDIDLTLSATGAKGSGLSAACSNVKPTFSGKQNPSACNGQASSPSQAPSSGQATSPSQAPPPGQATSPSQAESPAYVDSPPSDGGGSSSQ